MIAVVRTFTQRVSTSAANSSRFFSATGRMMANSPASKVNPAPTMKSSGPFRPMAPIFQERDLNSINLAKFCTFIVI